MKLADALQPVSLRFLDTAPVIYYVERNPKYVPVVDEVFERMDRGTLPVVTSPITLLECLVVPCRLGQITVQLAFRDLLVHGPGVSFVRVDETVAQRAAELRAKYNLALADACQVATALVAGCNALLTNDVALKRVTELMILVLDELEITP